MADSEEVTRLILHLHLSPSSTTEMVSGLVRRALPAVEGVGVQVHCTYVHVGYVGADSGGVGAGAGASSGAGADTGAGGSASAGGGAPTAFYAGGGGGDVRAAARVLA